MSTLSTKNRCQFTFADGRRCRAPRLAGHPRLCYDHARKDARAQASESLAEDFTYFFSADYLSACDVSSAAARLIPAVLRGEVKPKTARTVAFLMQILLQSIRIAQREYIEAFRPDRWRRAIRNSVTENHQRRFPSDPPAPSSAPDTCAEADAQASLNPLNPPLNPLNTSPGPEPLSTPPSAHTGAPSAPVVAAGVRPSIAPSQPEPRAPSPSHTKVPDDGSRSGAAMPTNAEPLSAPSSGRASAPAATALRAGFSPSPAPVAPSQPEPPAPSAPQTKLPDQTSQPAPAAPTSVSPQDPTAVPRPAASPAPSTSSSAPAASLIISPQRPPRVSDPDPHQLRYSGPLLIDGKPI